MESTFRHITHTSYTPLLALMRVLLSPNGCQRLPIPPYVLTACSTCKVSFTTDVGMDVDAVRIVS